MRTDRGALPAPQRRRPAARSRWRGARSAAAPRSRRLPEALAPGASTICSTCTAGRRAATRSTRELRVRSSDPGDAETVLPVDAPRKRTPARIRPRSTSATCASASRRRGTSCCRRRSRSRVSWRRRRSGPRPRADAGARRCAVRRARALHAERARRAPRRRSTSDRGGPLPVVAVVHARCPRVSRRDRAAGVDRRGGVLPITLVGLGDAPLAIARRRLSAGSGGELRTVVPGRQFRLVLRGRGARSRPAPRSACGAMQARRSLAIPVVGAAHGGAPRRDGDRHHGCPRRRAFDVVGVGVNAVDHLCTVDPFPDLRHQADARRATIASPADRSRRRSSRCSAGAAGRRYVGTFGDGPLGELSRRSLADEGIDVARAPRRVAASPTRWR